MEQEDISYDNVPMPWDTLFPKQQVLFNAGNPEYSERNHPNFPAVVLAEGPRWSSKTIGVCHRVIRHLWETPGAHGAMVAKTIPSAKDAGSWLDLTDIAMPMWLQAGIVDPTHGGVFRYLTHNADGVPGPIQSAKSRTMFFEIENAFGGRSRMDLISLQHDHKVKEELKNTRYSLLWFVELANFRDPNVLLVSLEQLRMFHLKRWQHLWIGDTNPSKEGRKSWIWKKWIGRESTETDPALANSEEFRKAMIHVHFDLRDNLALSQEECDARAAMYADDPGERDREFLGIWTEGSGNLDKHFADIFIRSQHVIGEEHAGEIEIDSATDTLITGWDIGKASNHASGIIEKRYVYNPPRTEMWSIFSILDSVLHVSDLNSVSVLGTDMLDKMDAIEHEYTRKFRWTHYADDSAFTVWNASSEAYDHEVIQNVSDGRIVLAPVPKPDRSVQARVRLLRQLLREGRLFVAGKCMDVIFMFENLKRGGNNTKDYVLWNEHKHVFDWISYAIWMECFEELDRYRVRPRKSGVTQVDLR